MECSPQKSENYGRWVVNSYISNSARQKGNNDFQVTYTADPFDPADILYTFEGFGRYAVEVKVRDKEYPTMFYEQSKDKGLQEYRQQGYSIIYANVVEDTGRLYMWNVTDLKRVKGIKTTVAPCFASIYFNPVIVAKPIYELPLTSAFVNADVKSYIEQYIYRYADNQQTEKENKR